ncbi:MAG: hypothetical protein M3R15_11555, partial [Acidobacteriota bacterium]|nr:hypothetical protein [Acidobacteriota bacterium]
MRNKRTTVFSAPLFVTTVLLVTLGSVCTQTIGAQDQPARAQASATTMKGILAKVAVSVRTGFLESMFFVDGRLASVRISEIKGALNKSDYLALKRSIGLTGDNVGLTADNEGYACVKAGECVASQGHLCNPQYCTGVQGILLKELLRKVPPAQRRQFLDSLDFAEGRVTSINAKVIEKHALQKDLA